MAESARASATTRDAAYVARHAPVQPILRRPGLSVPELNDDRHPDTPARPAVIALCGLVMAFGLLLLALANVESAHGRDGYWLFWAGIVAIFTPAVWRLIAANVGRGERAVLVVMEGSALLLAKVVREPTTFTFHDEFAHWANAEAALRLGRLFSFNPLIPTTARYPGLTDVTVAVARLTGLSVFTSGTLIIGAARVVLCLALFFLLDRLAGARLAGIAALIYFANPNFLYWSAQYAYESLALPLALFALWLAVRGGDDRPHRGWRLACLVTISAVVITHHITSYALAVVLCGWAVAGWRRRRRGIPCYAPAGLAAYAVGAAAAWLAFVAPGTVGYLGPVLGRAVASGVALLVDHTPSRQLFAGSGPSAPSWEAWLAFAAVGLLLVCVLVALLAFRPYAAAHPLVATLAVGCLLYVVLLPLRLTAAGQETANRSSEYVFVSLGLIDAGVVAWLAGKRPSAPRRALGAAWLLVVLVGGVTVSWAFAQRLQPDFSVAGVPTQPTPAAAATAEWMLTELGPGHRIGTDAVDDVLLGSYAEQDPVFQKAGAPGNPHIWQVFFPTTVNAEVRAEIQSDRLQYLVVNLSLTQGPAGSLLFDAGEPALAGNRLPSASLTKFDNVAGFSRLYDSGQVVVYQIGAQS